MSDKAWGEIMDEMDNEAKYAPPEVTSRRSPPASRRWRRRCGKLDAVFESWHDDETEVELLPQLRPALAPEQDK